MDHSLYVTLVIILSAGIFAAYFIKRQVTIRNNRFCPVCGHKMEVQHRSRHLDPKTEYVTIGKHRVLSGTVKEYWSVIHCNGCGYEFKI